MTGESLFHGTSGPRDARLIVVGESWGEYEAAKGQPFVGTSGQELTRMLADAGIARQDVLLTNVVSERPPSNEMASFFYTGPEVKALKPPSLRGLFPKPNVLNGIDKLNRVIEAVRPNGIIALGNYALWALTQDNFSVSTKKLKFDNQSRKVPAGIMKWRGSFLEHNTNPGWKCNLVPAIHPAAIQREWYLRDITVQDFRARGRAIAAGPVVPPAFEFHIRPTIRSALAAIEELIRLPAGSRVACDIETRSRHVACIGFATSRVRAFCIPLLCVERDAGYWSPQEEALIHQALVRLFSRHDLRWVGQNFLYDAQYVWRYFGVLPKISLDTMFAHHLLWPGTPKGLDYLSSLYCEYHRYWKEEGKYWEDDMPEDQLWTYNCKDCVVTWECAEVLDKLIDTMKMRALYEERLDVCQIALEMMLRGIKMDIPETNRQLGSVMEESFRLQSWFDSIMPKEFIPAIQGPSAKSPWYTSPQQQMSFFYEVLGVPPIENIKTGNPTVDDDALIKIAERAPIISQVCNNLQTYRSLGVYRSTFLTAARDFDGRMRCSFGPAGTSTFRFNSSENAFGSGTNLQNIPKGEEHD